MVTTYVGIPPGVPVFILGSLGKGKMYVGMKEMYVGKGKMYVGMKKMCVGMILGVPGFIPGSLGKGKCMLEWFQESLDLF